MKSAELTRHLDELLDAHSGRDYCPNGLQVEGRREPVRRVALGVSASLAFLERAAAWEADVALVHHGLFWGGAGSLRIERSLRRRLAVLFESGMTLLAYHLPLDRHLVHGNNALLARRLGASEITPEFELEGLPIGVVARFPTPLSLDAFARSVAKATGRDPLVVAGGAGSIERAGLVTGAAAKALGRAVELDLDLFLTGEPSEASVHLAREEGVHLVAAGHHATERFGVQSLGQHLETELGLETRFIEVSNPV